VTHVVLVTYGEPTTASFVEQLVYSWRILVGLTRSVADIPAPLIPLIAVSRGHGRRALWRRYSYSSPLEPITLAQAAQMRTALAGRSAGPWTVHIAYEFRKPLLADVIGRLADTDPVVVVPMYAADSAFTHQLSRGAVAALNERRRAPIVVLPPIDVDALAAISAAHVRSFIGDGVAARSAALVLAAHGTLLEPARPIDTGRVATEQLCEGITKRLAGSFGMIANGWLNHLRGGRWTEPPIEETLQKVSDAGYREVIYYPYGFLADNAESQLEGQIFAAQRPELRVRFVPCLNASPALADVIAAQVTDAAHAPRGTAA